MILKEIEGDLLTTPVDIIVQQTNCLTVRPFGLSKTISQKLNIDTYKSRKCLKTEKNLAIKEDRGTPGKPQVYHKHITRYHGFKDDRMERLLWFNQGLDILKIIMKKKKLNTIAFPKYIGCGLAGGDWGDYYELISDFAIKSYFAVYIVEWKDDDSPQYQLIKN